MRIVTPRALGALVKEARVGAALTQAALGRRIGASRYWVAEFERGKPSAELGLALKALHALGLSVTIEMIDSSGMPPAVPGPSAATPMKEPRRGAASDAHAQPPVDLAELLADLSTPARAGRSTMEPFRRNRTIERRKAPHKKRARPTVSKRAKSRD